MPTIEMLVSLKVPDNVAITAFNTLKRMGYNELVKLERADYYKFEISGDKSKFRKDISGADVLVNANKHKLSFSLEKSNNEKQENKKCSYKPVNILVHDIGNGAGLLATLKERLGFSNIKRAEKGVLWAMRFNGNADAEKTAIDITKNLLMNENYQNFKIIRWVI